MKHSCEQAIIELIGKTLQVKNDEMHTAVLFLDLSKALDMFDQEILLKKLDLYDWFRDYLTHRTLVTKLTVNSQEIVKSKSYNITYDIHTL